MRIESLGYAVVGCSDLPGWRQFGTEQLGLEASEATSRSQAFRMDERRCRLLIDAEQTNGTCFFGWETSDQAALWAIADRLDDAGVEVRLEPSAIAEKRAVGHLISFRDPVGNRVEVFCDPVCSLNPFVAGRALSGFRTGSLGMGHAVLTVKQIDEVLPFYVDLLGFRESDYMVRPFKAHFLHVNRRHHSLALISTGNNGVHHIMIEMFAFDDVGQGYDLATDAGHVNVTLGRHSNDYITSYYLNTPSPFLFECGWGGREIDPANWISTECVEGPSIWGHDRSWLSANDREKARQLRMEAAASGVRFPVHVVSGQFEEMLRDECWPIQETGHVR